MLLLLLFTTGLFAGLVDAIAGGGGLISVPILLSTGMPPHLVLGTNKLQGALGTFVAARKYYQHGLIKKEDVFLGIACGTGGAILGAIANQILSSDILYKIVPVLLFILFLYTLFTPKLGNEDRKSRLSASIFYLIFGFGLGFYDGFFGPGTGSFWVFMLTFFLGYNLIKATAYTKIFNLNSSLVASFCFAIGGNIDYRIAICMAAGSFLGGKIGAHLAIHKGAKLIRPVFLCVVSGTLLTLIYKTYANSTLLTEMKQQYGMLSQVIIGSFLLLSITFVYIKRLKRATRNTP